MNATVIVSIVGTLVSLGVAALAYLGVRIQARSQSHNTDVSVAAAALADGVETWRAIAERAEGQAKRAEEKADDAVRRSKAAEYEARAAREQNERLQQDTVALVTYLHATWLGVLDGSVPPHLPIPERLRHLLSDADFPPHP